jgi:transcriptional regulator with XRE-family HTH domain
MIRKKKVQGGPRKPSATLIAGLIDDQPYAMEEIARHLGVSLRAVWAWRRGEYQPSVEHLERLIELMLPIGRGALPIYSPNMAIDCNTRVGGVGQYTIESAYGEVSCSD